MIIAHIPAGYILTKSLQKKFQAKSQIVLLTWIGIFASFLPDLDLFFFYFVDNRQFHHHMYWVHIPFWWVLIAAITAPILFFFKNQKFYWVLYIIFFANIFLHLFLDTIVGDIMWFYPFSYEMIHFFYVQPRFDTWILSFVFHWSFILEIVIVLYAMWRLYRNYTAPAELK